MTETLNSEESTKVYELAKELGIDSISLLDKLKDLGIQVKNHMSSLSSSQVATARENLGDKKAKSSTTTRTRKKPVTTVVRKRPTEDAPATAASASAQSTPSATPAASVIRRRKTGTKPTPVQEETVSHEPPPTEAPSVAASEEVPPQTNVEPLPEPPQSEPTPVQVEESSPEIAASEVAPEPVAPKVYAPTRLKPAATPGGFLKIIDTPKPVPRPAAKVIAPKSATPTPAGGAKTVISPVQKGVDGTRIIKMSKEKLDQMAEEEAAKKRALREREEIKPEDVRFADYRKKEIVFLPKKKRVPVGKEVKKTQITTPAAHKRVVEVHDTITIADMANQMGLRANDLIKKLMGMGQMATINQSIDFDTAQLIAAEFKFEVKNIAFKEEQVLKTVEDKAEDLTPRPPVVTVMGHVDHGKTSLLDAIRSANVASKEAGGITQHIGAYTVKCKGQDITFLDTPGHEAFSLMRARGATVTDIVILVVAADDGVMPQTREALSHAREAKVPIIVAVNKIDKPGANPEKVKQALAELNLLAEDWGGDTMFVPVSAIEKTNIDKLLEAILLNAEMLELKANPKAQVQGTVLESRLEKGRGSVVSVLVTRGTLKQGDYVLAGNAMGRVRALHNDRGERIQEVLPGYAGEILGFDGVPSAGDRLDGVHEEADAKKLSAHREEQMRAKQAMSSKMSLEDLFSKISSGNMKELKIVLKTDVFGSLEAIKDSLLKLSTDKAKVSVIHAAPGGITESDVMLASASQAIIIGFNVRPETRARQIAESEGLQIQCYSIIYELIDDVKKAMTGLLDKKQVEKFVGRAEVRQTFSVPKAGVIAGSAVIDGRMTRNSRVRLLRDSRIIYDGKLSSLKRFKDDAREVASGYECGIGLENFNDIKTGDLIEAYEIELVSQEL